jgi:virginiamycin B lyase
MLAPWSGGTIRIGERRLSMRLLALAFWSGCVFALAAASSSTTIKAFPVSAEHPHGIVYDPAGPLQGLWFDNRTTDDTSSVVEFVTTDGSEKSYLTPTAGSQPGSINIAADHSIWFTESAANKIGTITLTRAIKEYPVPTQHAFPLDITRGPDGAMWFVEEAAGKVGRVTPDGTVKEFVVGDLKSHPTALITGPDKAIWFTEVGTNTIGRLTTTGGVRHFRAGAGAMTGALTTAIDGSLWFGKRNAVTRMTTTGARTEYNLRNAINTGSIFGSRNGGVFIGVMDKNGTGSVTTVSADGQLRKFEVPQKSLIPAEFAQTADGAFWMSVVSFDARASPAQLFNFPLPTMTDLPRTTIVTGGGPDWMATGDDAMWIANISLKEVERIDATTNAITARIPVHGVPCSARRSVFQVSGFRCARTVREYRWCVSIPPPTASQRHYRSHRRTPRAALRSAATAFGWRPAIRRWRVSIRAAAKSASALRCRLVRRIPFMPTVWCGLRARHLTY